MECLQVPQGKDSCVKQMAKKSKTPVMGMSQGERLGWANVRENMRME
jgi:hypothetical protein